jgi:tetratricopeptide (TPR) repeat protein
LAGYEQTLRVSLEIGDRWAAWLTVSNIGAVADRLQAAEPAEVLYRRAVGIGKRLGSPTYQTNMLVALAGLLLEQGRPAEASPIYREALETMARVEGEQIGGQDIRFSAQVLDVRLRHALGELDRTDAAAELRALLDQRSAPDQQAELHYELWRLDPEDEQARCKAAELYGSLHVEFDWIIDADDDAYDFTARLSGILNTRTGSVVMNGAVVEGWLLGARVHEEGQLVDPATLGFEGSIRLMPATAD